MAFMVQQGWLAYDPDTGATIRIQRKGPVATSLRVTYSSEAIPAFYFDLSLMLKDTRSVAPNRTPTIRIHARSIEAMLARLEMADRAANTDLLLRIIAGLRAINRHAPLTRVPYFYSDYATQAAEGTRFSFDMPDDEELLKLSA